MKKDFDCVEMKWEIQRRIQSEYAGIPEGEARRLQWEKALADPILGRVIRAVMARQQQAGAEPPQRAL